MGDGVSLNFTRRCEQIYTAESQTQIREEQLDRVGTGIGLIAVGTLGGLFSVMFGALGGFVFAKAPRVTFVKVLTGMMGTTALLGGAEFGVICGGGIMKLREPNERAALHELGDRFIELINTDQSNTPEFTALIANLSECSWLDMGLFFPYPDASYDRSALTAENFQPIYEAVRSDKRSWISLLKYAVLHDDFDAVTQLIEAGASAKNLLPVAREAGASKETQEALRAAGAEEAVAPESCDLELRELLKQTIRDAYSLEFGEAERERLLAEARFQELIRLNQSDSEEFAQLLELLRERNALVGEIFEPYVDFEPDVVDPAYFQQFAQVWMWGSLRNPRSHMTYMELAVRADDAAAIEALAEAGASMGPSHGRNLIVVALQSGASPEVLEALIEADVHLPRRISVGQTLVEWAEEQGVADEVLDLLAGGFA